MKTTLIRPDGTRLVIEPSIQFGNVRLYVLGEAEIITIPVCLAGIVAGAIEAAATLIEESCQPELADLPSSAIQCTACTTPRPDCMGAVMPGIGDRCGALSPNTSSQSDDVAAREEGASVPSSRVAAGWRCSKCGFVGFWAGGPHCDHAGVPYADNAQVAA